MVECICHQSEKPFCCLRCDADCSYDPPCLETDYCESFNLSMHDRLEMMKRKTDRTDELDFDNSPFLDVT